MLILLRGFTVSLSPKTAFFWLACLKLRMHV
ncbi:hypothetical protein ACLHG3_000063 [Serratia marcescens]